MNWESFKEKVAYKVEREIDKQSRPLLYQWTIGDGRTYETRKQAEVMSYINANGCLFLDTVLGSKKTARAVDELIEQGIIKSVESERDDLLKFEVQSVNKSSTINRKLPSPEDMDWLDDLMNISDRK